MPKVNSRVVNTQPEKGEEAKVKDHQKTGQGAGGEEEEEGEKSSAKSKGQLKRQVRVTLTFRQEDQSHLSLREQV